MSLKEPRLSHQTLKVLRLFLERPAVGLAGSDIWKETRIFSGTLYPILIRLEKAGWLESRWEELDPRQAGRPRKRLYRLTNLGRARAQAAFAELELGRGAPAWA